MELLDNPVRTYDWGSRTFLAGLRGRSVPSAEPEAELWIGAHPSAPSTLLVDGAPVDLDAYVARDPRGVLGAAVLERFGPRLPFLLKLIAFDRALSLQVHPSEARASAGFAAEQAAGLAQDAAARRYRDPHGKRELLVALVPTDVLCGLLEPGALRRRLEALGLGGAELDAARDPHGLLREVLCDGGARAAALLERCRAHASRPDAHEAARLVVALDELHPGDAAAAATLCLGRFVLSPGEAVYLPSGTPHAYLRGAGVEVMSCSDNVLRAGLTSKLVDVEGFLEALADDTVTTSFQGRADGDATVRWDTPAPEFRLSQVALGDAPVAFSGDGVEVLLVTSGTARRHGAGGAALAAGTAVLLRADAEPALLSGPATVFRVSVAAANSRRSQP